MTINVEAQALRIRAELIDAGEYNAAEVNRLLDAAETEDDGFDSVRTLALRLLSRALSTAD